MDIETLKQHLLLEGIFLNYGYDFREYTKASVKRRLDYISSKYNLECPLMVLKKSLDDKEFFNELVPLLTTTTTEFFRDPEFFLELRNNVIPILKTYPTLKIWLAGCSTGEEAYSLAILLKEEGLLQRSTIYATDINQTALNAAKNGIYDSDSMKIFTKNYTEAGGKHSPSEYYVADYGSARMDSQLKQNIVFTDHNLVIDKVFTEAHLILCRNVLIYFDRPLQDKVLQLFTESLVPKGILALGSKESIYFSTINNSYKTLSANNKIFQKDSYSFLKTAPVDGRN